MEILQPAQLAFLAIYNPSLGRTDETVNDQVVYYYSAPIDAHRKHAQTAEDVEQAAKEEHNERLRQIGLAQGMVEFAKAFSEGEPVESIDAEKSRIVLHQLEHGWWLLASIDLTHLRNVPSHNRSKPEDSMEEYSAREVAPQELLLQQLLRAHSVFLLHHAASLADLYVRLPREKFCGILEIFWNRVLASWDVLLHGNPAVEIFHGIKLATGGELGVGVGEEEWGSGERAVLEGFVGRTEGLVDVVASRFGDGEASHNGHWLGRGISPEVHDGMIFSGVGALTRHSVRGLSSWLETVFIDGVAGYGVMDNPQSLRRRRRKKQISYSGRRSDRKALDKRGRENASRITSPVTSPGIPPPIVQATNQTTASATRGSEEHEGHDAENTKKASLRTTDQPDSESSTADTWVKYMTLGVYGSTWGIPAGRPRSQSRAESSEEEHKRVDKKLSGDVAPSSTTDSPTKTTSLRSVAPQPIEDNDPNAKYDLEHGCFLIGLRGDLNSTSEASDLDLASDSARPEDEDINWNQRIVVRTLHLQLPNPSGSSLSASTNAQAHDTCFDRFRVVLYARRPFLFAFIFNASTPSLSYAELYHSLHQQLAPLHKSLLRSTSPSLAHARTSELRTPRTAAATSKQASDNPVWDVVYDPTSLDVIATLPNIPEPAATAKLKSRGAKERVTSISPASSAAQKWTRLEALHVQSQVLATVAATRHRTWERERVLKTARGWWVVWLRVVEEQRLHSEPDPSSEADAQENPQAAASYGEGTKQHNREPMERNPSISPAASSSISEHLPEPATRCEAILVRHATETPSGAMGSGTTKKASGWGSVAAVFTGGSPLTSPSRGGSSSLSTQHGEGEAVGRMVEGVGLDARRYVEGLLKARR